VHMISLRLYMAAFGCHLQSHRLPIVLILVDIPFPGRLIVFYDIEDPLRLIAAAAADESEKEEDDFEKEFYESRQ